MDSRGRLTIGRHVRRNGIEPARDWALSFGPDRILILTPVLVPFRTEPGPESSG